MSFKIYKNKKTNHPSVSLRQKDKSKWFNLPMSHSKPSNDAYLEIDDPNPNSPKNSKTFIRKYVRKDKIGVKGHIYNKYVLSTKSENNIKQYLRNKYKKR